MIAIGSVIGILAFIAGFIYGNRWTVGKAVEAFNDTLLKAKEEKEYQEYMNSEDRISVMKEVEESKDLIKHVHEVIAKNRQEGP